jgi:DNA polymerase III alpha subunit
LAALNSNNEIIVSENDLVEMMLSDIKSSTVTMSNTAAIDQYNHFCNLFLIDGHIDVETPDDGSDKYNKALADNWFMPDEYKNMTLSDVENFLHSKCNTDQEWSRACAELDEYKNRDLLSLLKYMIYLVDFMRENNIVWGVGRGSSVASYVLYLIGVHRIDSVKYDLDYKEFFR